MPKKTKFEVDKYKGKLEEQAEEKHVKLEAKKVGWNQIEYDRRDEKW